MKYCSHCGAELQDEGVRFCPKCGAETTNPNASPAVKNDDASSIGFAILSFFIPLVGLILYCVWKSDYPLRAKSAGKGALIGVITWVALAIIMVIISVIFAASAFSSFSRYYYY